MVPLACTATACDHACRESCSSLCALASPIAHLFSSWCTMYIRFCSVSGLVFVDRDCAVSARSAKLFVDNTERLYADTEELSATRALSAAFSALRAVAFAVDRLRPRLAPSDPESPSEVLAALSLVTSVAVELYPELALVSLSSPDFPDSPLSASLAVVWSSEEPLSLPESDSESRSLLSPSSSELELDESPPPPPPPAPAPLPLRPSSPSSSLLSSASSESESSNLDLLRLERRLWRRPFLLLDLPLPLRERREDFTLPLASSTVEPTLPLASSTSLPGLVPSANLRIDTVPAAPTSPTGIAVLTASGFNPGTIAMPPVPFWWSVRWRQQTLP